MYISKHWSTQEWDCYGRQFNHIAHDNEDGRLITNDEGCEKLFKILDMLREWNPYWVINWTEAGYKSGYRNALVNEEVGGVPNSLHLIGAAADLHEANTDATSEELAETVLAAARCYGLENEIELGIYVGQGWVHLGCGGYSNIYYA